MRVAYVCADPGVPVFGRKGCSVHVQEVIAALLRRGAEVDLFASRLDDSPLVDRSRLKVHALPSLPQGDAAARERAALAANAALAGRLEEHGPFDLVYERYSLWSYAGMEYGRSQDTPALLEVNAPLIEEQARHRALIDRQAAEEAGRRAFSAADRLIAVSEPVATWLEEQPAACGRVSVIHNGVDPQRFRPGMAAALPAPSGTLTIGFVGSMKPWHGLTDLVEAFEILHRRQSATRLLLVGEGPERAAILADLARRNLTQAVVATGAIDPADVPGLLASIDIAVAPYPDLPGFYFSPLKVYEYMAAGVPVVACRVGSLPSIIEDRRTGLLAPPGDAHRLAAQLELLCRDAPLRERLGRAARAWVLGGHTWDAVVAKIVDLAGCATDNFQVHETLVEAVGR